MGERNLESRAKRELYKDPHRTRGDARWPLPDRARGSGASNCATLSWRGERRKRFGILVLRRERARRPAPLDQEMRSRILNRARNESQAEACATSEGRLTLRRAQDGLSILSHLTGGTGGLRCAFCPPP